MVLIKRREEKASQYVTKAERNLNLLLGFTNFGVEYICTESSKNSESKATIKFFPNSNWHSPLTGPFVFFQHATF